MRPRLLPILALTALGLLGGCSSSTEEATGEDQGAIIGGTNSSDKRVMLLRWEDKAGSGSKCSSVLIAPDVLLTVAHCLAGAPKDAIYRASPDASINFQDMDRSGWVRIKNVQVHPSYDNKHPELGHDLAVAFLDRPFTAAAPYDIAPWQLPASWADASTRAENPVTARIVGYGLESDRADPDRAGRRREDQVPMRALAAQTILLGDGVSGQACLNDSGGPALISYRNKEYVVSVASFMFGKKCTTGNHGTRLDVNWPFLKSALGPRLPAEQEPAPADFPGNPHLGF